SLVVGKGGVGKTTCAAGLAAHFAKRGERTLLVSTDPAAALADVIGADVSTSSTSIVAWPNLDARQLDAGQLRTEFLDRWRDTIAEIVDRGTYLDRADVDGLVDAALPGADEIFALLALAEILADPAATYTRIVVDTAPTGHTLRLLALPETFRALVSMLDLMQDKHRFMVRALTHRYRRDRADEFLDEMRARIDGLRAALADSHTLAAIVVTRDEPVVAAETRRYLDSLAALRVRVAAIIVNASTGSERADESANHFWLPTSDAPPRGLTEIATLLERLATAPPPAVPSLDRSTAPPFHRSTVPPFHRKLTIVAGKGGVGKSTVACALAIAVTEDAGGTTLLVSTDPAPSIADALGMSDAPWARADVEAEIQEVPGLVVRQMDASAAFARVRETYQSRIDALFSALVSRGVDVEHDRAILRDLLALAPPGIDEVFALSILGDALAEGRFTRIIVDPAPTGHLLRLLEMPSIALDWTHRLMRLMLKYRDVVPLGDSAQELLDFAKRTRALDALLRDERESAVVIVALDEPVVRAETARLADAVHARGMSVSAVTWNRVVKNPEPLPANLAAHQFCAEEVRPAPIGIPALRAWSRTWHAVTPHS
ncbi:MAG TPA: ArsA family ATPase, partial [Gemmatimonadaceae bacterium]